ncbi:hypothetical protein [Gracilimonas sediminicola]|uniref:Uncharacterized protein n=1 Tax=Gracilimonas sediminicola TaxID=2952158 RepID=A0A9X2L3F5_9BACT|nr:hypothetical protein [Gracilimonas sediminicola]MCP9291616.1 hypothetical protein [Gracilimonas sediminicola]
MSDAKSGDAKSGDAKSGDAKSGDAKSGDAKSGDAKSEEAKSGESSFKGMFSRLSVNDKLSESLKFQISLLENRFLRIVISIGLAFLILKTIDTSYETSYLKGRQESFEQAVQVLLDDRDVLIEELNDENFQLKEEILSLKKLRLENDSLKLELKTYKNKHHGN